MELEPNASADKSPVQLDPKVEQAMQHVLAKMQAISPYVGTLKQKIGLYMGWVPNDYADAVAADNAYDLLKGDPEVARCIHMHSSMAAGEKIRVLCEDERLKYILETLINYIHDFNHSRKSLIENGMLFGLGIQRKYYKPVKLKEFPGFSWIAISEIKEVDTRRLRLERDTEDRNILYWTIWQPTVDQYVRLYDRSEKEDVPPGDGLQDYLWYFHEREELNPYFRGVGAILYPLVYTKKAVFQYWADLCESWSKPFLVAMLDLMRGSISAALGGDIKTAEERVNDWLSVLQNARARHALVMDKNDSVNFFEHGSTGNNIIHQFLQYIDEKIMLMLLGAELTTGTGSGVGSYALGNVHRQQTETLIMYSRSRLQESLELNLIYDLLYQNRMNLYRLGIQLPDEGEIKLDLYTDLEEQKNQAMEQKMDGFRGDMQKVI